MDGSRSQVAMESFGIMGKNWEGLVIYFIVPVIRDRNEEEYRFSAASSTGIAPGAAVVVMPSLSKRLALRPIGSLNDDDRSCTTGWEGKDIFRCDWSILSRRSEGA